MTAHVDHGDAGHLVTLTDGRATACNYFALCSNEATGVVEHPVLGYVPTCRRCADTVGVHLIVGRFVPDGDYVNFEEATT